MADEFLNKIDSNVTGLRFCEEATIGNLPVAASQVWYPLEPNSYSNWGGQTKLTQRSPITATRQKKKGVLTDLDAAGSANMDMTATNYQRIMQGFMFADFREKFDTQSYVGANTSLFAVAATSTFKLNYGDQVAALHAHNLIFVTHSAHAENNGLFHVASTASAAAAQTLTITSTDNAVDAETATIGSVVYTFQDTLTNVAGHIKIGADKAATLANLAHAINGTGGTSGTDYAAANVAHPDVTATVASPMVITAKRTGYAGNAIVTTETMTHGSWGAATAAGGTANIVVSETTLVNEASPSTDMRVECVGVEFTAADATITNSGTSYPVLGTSTFDLTTLGLIPGEFAYIGGDSAGTEFATDTDNGFVRIRSIAAHALTLDKTTGEMVTDAGTGKTVQVFYGRVVKNEANNDGVNSSIPIKRRTYQMERTLGNPSVADPTATQAEYLVGAVPNTFKMTLKTADKVVSDMDFVALTTDLRTVDEGPKSEDMGADAPALISEDAFNTTSHVARIRLAAISTIEANPTALIGFVSDLDFTIDNMLKANKAIGVLGAFEVTAGHFMVNGTIKAYFSTVEAQQAVKDNGDITLDICFVDNNKGVVVDMPLIALSDGRPDVVSDEPIMLPLNLDLAPDPVFNHELLWCFFGYLPNVAQPDV